MSRVCKMVEPQGIASRQTANLFMLRPYRLAPKPL